MAQKHRKPSKDAGYEYLTVMVPSEFRAQLLAEAEAEGRTLSDVARRRLLGDADRLSPPTRAISRLIELLAEEVFSSAGSLPEGLEEIGAGTTVLLNELLAAFNDPDFPGIRRGAYDEWPVAETFARLLAQKVIRAHSPVKRADEYSGPREAVPPGALVRTTIIRLDELLRIQKALGLSPESLDKTAGSQGKHSRKEQDDD
jgi:hypothetical protein